MKTPKMTKAHYELIASIIRRTFSGDDRRYAASAFAAQLIATNPAFDIPRFIEAATRREPYEQ